ncbi:carbonic anhydrase [Bacteroides sp.]|uniref:beta-class carbonic anhydrase n=1 Tax=Bacteroides sp. TaxID=29523 RepID=UPI001B609772|nr:carbonic anhydrase [Bacteroides sp.]MBP6064609.1 carbonic anhydrase [Bacteroides sp.]MBP6066950.1 carbonic anhydrase [Bacteroides sp.]MBP6935834.1 carbonic anhydrase [Bacteroides sp.]MBP8622250.1 carbonic anhydrase [Bacteroides sp.]MBP9506817.1 carbonic anhydrase [Bacteroides sp.]
MIDEILEFNKKFVKEQKYEKYITNKYPNKKIAIVSCMDTRLTELIPAALGLKNGDMKMIKNAGGVISHPFGSAMRSLVISIYELGVKDVMIIGHTDCGTLNLDSKQVMGHMVKRGISMEQLKMLEYCGVDFNKWIGGFSDTNTAIRQTVDLVRNHPLVPEDVSVQGFIIDSVTGELRYA